MSKSLAVLVLSVLLSSIVNAQSATDTAPPSSHESIAAWVQSGDARQLSWAAVEALRLDDKEFLPAFQSLAERWEALPHHGVRENGVMLTDEQRGRRDAMAAILDVIIQWHGSLSTEALRNLSDDFPAAAIALLARLPAAETDAVWMDLYSKTVPSSWYTERAAASMLAQHPNSGFVASLLTHTTVQAYVFVTLKDDPDLGIGIGEGSCGASSLYPVKKGWPDIGRYSLRNSRPESPLPAYMTIQGIRPIDVIRRVLPTRMDESAVCEDFTPMDSTIRIALLAQMLGEATGQMPFKPHDQVNIKVATTDDYAMGLDKYVTNEEQAFHQIKQTLAEKSLLSNTDQEDTAVMPTLSLIVSDSRSRRHSLWGS